jgi:hypothetical protein
MEEVALYHDLFTLMVTRREGILPWPFPFRNPLVPRFEVCHDEQKFSHYDIEDLLYFALKVVYQFCFLDARNQVRRVHAVTLCAYIWDSFFKARQFILTHSFLSRTAKPKLSSQALFVRVHSHERTAEMMDWIDIKQRDRTFENDSFDMSYTRVSSPFISSV